ncbi:MAG: ATP-binding protein [Halolamina sp.]
MSSFNLTPIETPDQPTSHVTVGQSTVQSSADVVRVRCGNRKAFFEVETEMDRVASTIKGKARIAPEAAALFGGIEQQPFYVDDSVQRSSVRSATHVELNPLGADESALATALQDRNALLHPIHERYDLGSQTVEFVVTAMEPADATTLRVDVGTEFEFTTETAEAEFDPGGDGSGGDGSGGNGSGGNGSGGNGSGGAPGEEAEASIDITPTNPQVSFEEDVAGLSEVRRTAQMVLSLFDPTVREEVLDRYGEEFVDRGGGMLLYGPPGCGKTLVSEAIAHEAKYNTDIEESYGNVVFLEVRGSDVVSKYAGESEKNVHAAFEQAHEAVGNGGFGVLFFDEVETLIPDRSDDNLQRHERALTNAFLQEMNDVEDNLLVIGATNMPFSIDPAATRRFPIQQFIPQPDETVMADVWRKSLGRIAERDDVDFERLGEASVGYTPAEVADRILGSELQRELVESIVHDDSDPIVPDTEYLLDQLRGTEPKTVSQYVSSVLNEAAELEGYPEMKEYVQEQAVDLGMVPAGTFDDGGDRPE